MTMINALVQGKRAYMYSDTAWLNMHNVVVDFHPKLFVGSHFPWAIGVTVIEGRYSDIMHAVSVFSECRNVKSVVRTMPKALAAFEARSAMSGVDGKAMRLIATCWDARLQKPRIFGASNMPDGWEDFGRGRDVIEFIHHFGGLHSPSDLLGREVDPSCPKSFDPDDDGLAILQAQRDRPLVSPRGGTIKCGIGGEAAQLVITKCGVEQYSLYKWPDRVGGEDSARDRAPAERMMIPTLFAPILVGMRNGMAKNEGNSGGWLTKRDTKSGRFVEVKSAAGFGKSAVTGSFSLPNGDRITTVRKDVMDRALSRGEFKGK